MSKLDKIIDKVMAENDDVFEELAKLVMKILKSCVKATEESLSQDEQK